MSTYLTILQEALRLRPEATELYDAAVTAAVAEPFDPKAAGILMDLMIPGDNLTDEHRRIMLTFPDENVRHSAWHQFASLVPASLWETSIRAETDADVLSVMCTNAPWQSLSRPAVNRLLGEPEDSTRLRPASAERVLRMMFCEGMEDLWREALEVINPANMTVSFTELAVVPVLSGHVSGLDKESTHSDFLFAQACASTAPDGSLVELFAEHPELIDSVTAPDPTMTSEWITAVARTPVGRSRDLAYLRDATVGGLVADRFRPLIAHLPITDDDTEMMRYAVREATGGGLPTRFYGADLTANWNRLRPEARTDEVCTSIITSWIAPAELLQAAADHLGGRAGELLEDLGKLANRNMSPTQEPPKWVRLVQRDRWVRMLRKIHARTVIAKALEPATPEDIAAAADDLLTNPHLWAASAVQPLATAAGFGPEQWDRLTPTQVLNIGQHDPTALEWLTGRLAAAQLHKTTVALAATQVVTDETPLADALTALTAFA